MLADSIFWLGPGSFAHHREAGKLIEQMLVSQSEHARADDQARAFSHAAHQGTERLVRWRVID
jgi:hypothetical protein